MRHLKAHRKLGRTTEHRISLLRNLATSLINSEKEHIVTTVAKAKELRPFVEKAITLARKAQGLDGNDGKLREVHLRRQAARFFHAGNSTFKVAASRFRGKKGEAKDTIERTAGVKAVQRLVRRTWAIGTKTGTAVIPGSSSLAAARATTPRWQLSSLSIIRARWRQRVNCLGA